MAEARVTQAGVLLEVSGASAGVTLAGVLLEISPDGIRSTQAGVLVEFSQDAAEVTLAGVLLEFELPPPVARPTAGGDAQAGTGSPAAAAARMAAAAVASLTSVSVAAGRAGDALFAALAASRAAVGPGTVLPASASGQQGGGMSEARRVTAQVLVWWDGVHATDESAHLVSAKGSHGLTAPEGLLAGGRGAVDGCSIVLSNQSRRFSPRNPAGPLGGLLGSGGAYLRPVSVSVTVDGVSYLLFTGVVREVAEAGATSTQAGTVTLDCRSREEVLLQDRRSSPLGEFLAASAAARGEAEHIVALLQLAGLQDGVDFVSQGYAASHPPMRPTVDPSIFAIRYVWLDDESVLEELWGLVAACCGWLYADQAGKIHYHNLCGVLPPQLAKQYGPVTTIVLDEGQAAGLRLGWPTAELYGEVTVEVAPRSPGPLEEVWGPDEPPVVQPGESQVIWARLDCALAAEPVLDWAAYTAGGLLITGGVSVTPEFFGQRVKLTITNATGLAAYLNKLTLTGQTLIGGRSLEVTETSSAAFWAGRALRRRSVRNNVYIQGEAQARTVARYLLARSELPALSVHVPGVDRPDVRVGWPVRVRWLGAVPEAGEVVGLVQEVQWSLDQSGFHADVDVLETGRLAARVGAWFVLGSNRLGDAGGAGEGFLFY